MGGMYLDPVKAGRLGTASGLTKGVHSLADVLHSHLTVGRSNKVFDDRWTQRHHMTEFCIGPQSAMGQLQHDATAFAMDRCGHCAQAFNASIMVNTQLAQGGLSGRTHVRVTGDDQPWVSSGQIFHEVNQFRRAGTVFRGQSHPGSGANEPIGKC